MPRLEKKRIKKIPKNSAEIKEEIILQTMKNWCVIQSQNSENHFNEMLIFTDLIHLF